MGRGGHGSGVLGSAHSHDPENPDDAWNLYQHINQEEISLLNGTEDSTAISVFKPHTRRLEAEPMIASDADEELMIVVSPSCIILNAVFCSEHADSALLSVHRCLSCRLFISESSAS